MLPDGRGPAWIWALLALLYAGCFPTSCHRIESRDIAPQDSISRRIAESLTPDTISSSTVLAGTSDHMLEWPRTILLDAQGGIYVGDTQRHSIFAFDSNGDFMREFTWPEASFPYLAGWRGDTLVVFTPAESQATVNYVVDAMQVRSFRTPEVLAGTLQYATVTESSVFVKAVTQVDTHYVWQLNHHGAIESKVQLHGTSWDHAGLLRANGRTIFSLTGFFPRITIWKDSLTGSPLSMRLRGFDSPMLRRSWAFLQGSARNAPLLTSSAVHAGDYWFVLNLRPGWLRIDVYDTDGDLKNILIEQDPGYLKQFYPLDIAVRIMSDDIYDMAVALVADVPVVRRYTWTATHSNN